MIVLDASAVVELITNRPMAETVRKYLAFSGEPMAVPHFMDVEVMSVLRKLTSANLVDGSRADIFIARLKALPAERYAHSDLLGRMWELRHSFTAYDAVYVALAERLNATLYTTDKKLLRGHRARAVLAQESLPH